MTVVTTERRAAIGLGIELLTTSPGAIAIEPGPDHRIKIHASGPVRGWCGSRPFLYRRGDVDIFPAGTSDVWEELEAGASLVLRLSPPLLRRAAEDMGVDEEGAALEPRHHFRDAQIEHIGWALDAERRAGHPSGPLYVESLGLALAAHLLGGHRAPLKPRLGFSGLELRRVAAYIEDHLDHDLPLARLAEVARMSASHFKVMFRRATGLPVHAYVIRRRVERAKALLERGELPIAQVALEAGFAHQSHLARWMRRLHGVSPASLARRSRAGARWPSDPPTPARRPDC